MAPGRPLKRLHPGAEDGGLRGGARRPRPVLRPRGSDEILNAIIAQATNAGRVILRTVQLLETTLTAAIYLAVALYLAPLLTGLTLVVLGGITYVVRFVIVPGYVGGDRVAEVYERVQTTVQAGTQGIRDVKVFGVDEELLSDFGCSIEQLVNASVAMKRNQTGINNLYQFTSAVTVFTLVYFSRSRPPRSRSANSASSCSRCSAWHPGKYPERPLLRPRG